MSTSPLRFLTSSAARARPHESVSEFRLRRMGLQDLPFVVSTHLHCFSREFFRPFRAEVHDALLQHVPRRPPCQRAGSRGRRRGQRIPGGNPRRAAPPRVAVASPPCGARHGRCPRYLQASVAWVGVPPRPGCGGMHARCAGLADGAQRQHAIQEEWRSPHTWLWLRRADCMALAPNSSRTSFSRPSSRVAHAPACSREPEKAATTIAIMGSAWRCRHRARLDPWCNTNAGCLGLPNSVSRL